MLPDRVSNPGPLTYESGALLIALLGPANDFRTLAVSTAAGVTSPHRLTVDFHWHKHIGTMKICFRQG